MGKVTKSLRVDSELWKEVKIHAARTDDEISSFIERAIKEKLKETSIKRGKE